MTVSTTVYGRWKVFTSTSSDAGTIVNQLTEALDGAKIGAERVIYVDATTKKAVAEVGR